MTSSEYRIEKIRRTLTVVLADGERIEGDVFLRPLSRYRSRPEEPADLLNDAEPFFALVAPDKALLVAKANVVLVETAAPAEEETELAALGVPVAVTLTDGTVCSGSVFLETRFDRPRLLDFLNAYTPRFLPIVDAGQMLLVNTLAIAHVREVS